MNIKELIEESFNTARDKGWWEDARPPMENLMLMCCEVSEAAEEYRIHGMAKDKMIYQADNGKYEGIAVELADVMIRISDFCGYWNIPLEEALKLKMEYNKSRPYRHGGKLA